MKDGKGKRRGDQSIKVRGIRGYQPTTARAMRQWKGIIQLYRVGEERDAELDVNPFREAIANRFKDEGRMFDKVSKNRYAMFFINTVDMVIIVLGLRADHSLAGLTSRRIGQTFTPLALHRAMRWTGRCL